MPNDHDNPPYHGHPDAIEMYFCFEGSRTMCTPEETIPVVHRAGFCCND